VETTAADGVIRIGFHDDGPGIPKEQLRKIFDPFFTTKTEGTGLGLSISYGIIKEHGGEISVQSVSGRGTSFRIQVPITTASPPAEQAPSPTGSVASAR
jgi:signal transduction histidine kinase